MECCVKLKVIMARSFVSFASNGNGTSLKRTNVVPLNSSVTIVPRPILLRIPHLSCILIRKSKDRKNATSVDATAPETIAYEGTVSGAIQTPSALLSVPNVEKHSREKTMWPSFLQGL